MVIRSKECLDRKNSILTCLNEEMDIVEIMFRDFLFSGDCLHRTSNGVMYMLQKDKKWSMDRYRNLLYIINREIGLYIRAEFNDMRETYRRVGPFEVRGIFYGTLPLQL